MELVEVVLKNSAWLVGILTGLVTTRKNLSDLKDKKKKATSPSKKSRK